MPTAHRPWGTTSGMARARVLGVEQHALADKAPCAPSEKQRQSGQENQGKCVKILANASGQAIDQDVDTNMGPRRQRVGKPPRKAESKHVARNLGGGA